MEWGDLATAAKAAGSLSPLWKKFIKTKFFVAIQRSPDDNPKNFLLQLAHSPDGEATLLISELRERLAQQGDGIVALSGAEIVRRLEHRGGIAVALRAGVFSISKKRVDWLGSGIEVTKKRIITRKILQAAAPAAPLPVLLVAPMASAEHEGEGWEDPPVAGALPLLASILQSGYLMPVGLSVAALGILAAIMISFGMSPDPAGAPAPTEAAAPAKPAASPGPGAAAPLKDSVTFTAAYTSFTVSVPGLAEEIEASPDQVRRMGDIESHQYRLQVDDRLYTMEVTLYHAGGPPSLAAAMDGVQQGIIGSDGVLIKAVAVPMPGAIGRELRVRLPNGSERAVRYAFIRNKLCMVMVTAPQSASSALQIDAFLNSFQLN